MKWKFSCIDTFWDTLNPKITYLTFGLCVLVISNTQNQITAEIWYSVFASYVDATWNFIKFGWILFLQGQTKKFKCATAYGRNFLLEHFNQDNKGVQMRSLSFCEIPKTSNRTWKETRMWIFHKKTLTVFIIFTLYNSFHMSFSIYITWLSPEKRHRSWLDLERKTNFDDFSNVSVINSFQ